MLRKVIILATLGAAALAVNGLAQGEKKTAAKKGAILQPQMTVETGSYSAPAGKLGQAVRAIDHSGGAAATLLTPDARGNSRSIRECKLRIVAGCARERSIRREPGIEVQQAAELRLLRRIGVIRGPDNRHQAKRRLFVNGCRIGGGGNIQQNGRQENHAGQSNSKTHVSISSEIR